MTGKNERATGVRRRLTHDQTRGLLLDWGAHTLFMSGLAYGMDAVSLEDAVRDTGVSRTSAYRIWSHDEQRTPQEAYRRDVLLHSIRNPAAADLDELAEIRDAMIDSVRSIAREARTPEAAAEAIGDLLLTQIVDHQAVTLSRSLVTSFAMHADTNGDRELLHLLDATEAGWRLAVVQVVMRPLIDTFGLVPRHSVPPETALEQASVAISSFISGILPKTSLPTAGAIIDKPLADGSNLRLGNVCLSALLMTFFEDPND